MNLLEILDHALMGVRASMSVVRSAQGKTATDIETKADETIVTATDRLSSTAAEPFLRRTDVPLMSEDGSQDAEIGRFQQYFDPLDGTSAFAGGMMTSTVIWSLYDRNIRQIVATIVGEPISGRIWSATSKSTTELQRLSVRTHSTESEFASGWGERKASVVSAAKISRKTTTFLDVSHGFTRSGRQILTDTQMGKLLGNLCVKTKINIPGSNGLIQALVANGGTSVVGSITTALGGPWDACGVLLVQKAGGFARAFSHEGNFLNERNPLSVEGYDILVTGNSEDTVNSLVESIQLSIA